MTITLQRPACSTCNGGAFSILTKLQTSRLGRERIPHTYGTGEAIFHEGNLALAVYCIHSGSVELFMQPRNGDAVVTCTRGPGDIIGLRAVLADVPYATTAMTLEPSVVCAISRACFLDLTRENAEFCRSLLTRLSREALRAEHQFATRTCQCVAERTARVLLDLARGSHGGKDEGVAVQLLMSREEMARLIGTTPETLSRTLHKFAERGIIELTGKRGITLRDLPALEKLHS